MNIKLTDEHYGYLLPEKMQDKIKKHCGSDDRAEAAKLADISEHTVYSVITGKRKLNHSNGVAIRSLLQVAESRAKIKVSST